jgi:hypothetical protein
MSNNRLESIASDSFPHSCSSHPYANASSIRVRSPQCIIFLNAIPPTAPNIWRDSLSANERSEKKKLVRHETHHKERFRFKSFFAMGKLHANESFFEVDCWFL